MIPPSGVLEYSSIGLFYSGLGQWSCIQIRIYDWRTSPSMFRLRIGDAGAPNPEPFLIGGTCIHYVYYLIQVLLTHSVETKRLNYIR